MANPVRLGEAENILPEMMALESTLGPLTPEMRGIANIFFRNLKKERLETTKIYESLVERMANLSAIADELIEARSEDQAKIAAQAQQIRDLQTIVLSLLGSHQVPPPPAALFSPPNPAIIADPRTHSSAASSQFYMPPQEPAPLTPSQMPKRQPQLDHRYNQEMQHPDNQGDAHPVSGRQEPIRFANPGLAATVARYNQRQGRP